nr:MAG TPA: hypothetical protein [Caudoviricetes sp.]
MFYLEHHGIKGQQWGVKHGPPYPINSEKSNLIIKKGTHFQRLSVYDEAASKGHAYVTFLKKDSRHYKGFFTYHLKMNNKGKTVYSIDMTAKKNLISPSKIERAKTFTDLYKKDKIFRKEMGNYYKDSISYITPLPRKFYQYKFSKLKDKYLKDKGYEIFTRALGGNEYIRSKYFNVLKKKGYDFVRDDLDGRRLGKEPSIIFDREKSLFYIGQKKVKISEATKIFAKEGRAMR